MKKIIVSGIVACFISSGCKRESIKKPINPTAPANSHPVARAGNDTTIMLPANRVLLNGSGSYDSDNNIASYRWSKLSGPGSFNIANANSAITEVTNLVKGNYEFLLKVTDSLSEESLDFIRVIVDTILPPPPPPPTPGNRPPSAYSGYDLIVHFPADTGYLYGGVYDPDNNIATIQWTKIAGPPSFDIVRPDSIFSRITNLGKGVYKFEIKVIDSLGLSARDTNTVIVGELPANPQEIILTNQPWGCHWDCYIQIERLYSTIPPDRVFKVFIKRDNSSNWHEVVPADQMILQSSLYGYGLRKGVLWIYYTEFDISDTPDIKIVY
jgi:hypothetical protein